MIRVVGGKYKRSVLNTLEGQATRPTRDMVKEALFSSVMIYSDTRFLDLFSGSGGIGIEALSRGAQDCVFNDASKDAVAIIRSNLKKLKEDRRVFQLDYERCLNLLKGEKFDVVYIDPPYAFEEYEKTFELLAGNQLLADDAIVIVEVAKERQLPAEMSSMHVYKEKTYGINKLLYYRGE